MGPGRAVVTGDGPRGLHAAAVFTANGPQGLLAGTPWLFGLPHAHVEETECQARGDEQCRYEVSWDAEQAEMAADPQQRVTALEASWSAMSERLQSVYATASDLVSTEDLDTVLHSHRRARGEHRARSEPHPGGTDRPQGAELQVYCHGIDDRQAREVLARATREPTPDEDSMLVVDVTSSRRDYGQLIACYPGANQFFPQERETLGLYAKHAAAVLDMAVALKESALRHEQVSCAAVALPRAGAGGYERGGGRAARRGDPRRRGLRPDRGVAVGRGRDAACARLRHGDERPSRRATLATCRSRRRTPPI